MKKALDKQAIRIRNGAEALYGEKRWQSSLAESSGLSQSLLSAIVAEDPTKRRAVTLHVANRIAETFDAEAKRLGVVKRQVEKLSREIRRNMIGIRYED